MLNCTILCFMIKYKLHVLFDLSINDVHQKYIRKANRTSECHCGQCIFGLVSSSLSVIIIFFKIIKYLIYDWSEIRETKKIFYLLIELMVKRDGSEQLLTLTCQTTIYLIQFNFGILGEGL